MPITPLPITPLIATSQIDPLADALASTPTSLTSSPWLQQLTCIRHNPDNRLPSRDLSDREYVRWGHEFRDLRTNQDGQGIYWFDDTYKGAPRLNIIGHSSGKHPPGEKMSFYMDGKQDAVDGADLKYLYDRNFGEKTLSIYQHIRVVSCHSAEGNNPLGQQIANAFKRETKAFSGYVDSLSPEAIERKKFNHAFKSADGTDADLNHALKVIGRSFVQKSPPSDPEKQKRWPGYLPTKFQPQ